MQCLRKADLPVHMAVTLAHLVYIGLFSTFEGDLKPILKYPNAHCCFFQLNSQHIGSCHI